MENIPQTEKEENNINEEKSKQKDNDIFLQDYLKFKNEFIKNVFVLGVKFAKNETSKYVKILKQYKPPYKYLNPIKHSKDSNENIYLTKFTYDEKNILENDILNREKNPDLKKEDKYTIVNEQLILNINNFSYDEIFTYFIEEEKNNKRLTDDDQTISKILKSIPNGFEVVGKIAHFNLRDEYLKYKYFIGQLVLDKNPSISTVVNKVGKIENVYRTYEMEIIAGEENYNVEHKEGNIKFKFDLRKTYWCSRLQSERDRILNLIRKNDVLCDAFCGVGPLALRACKKGAKVYANDLNPDAYEYLNNNIKINKLDKQNFVIKTYNMDAREFIKSLVNLTKINIDEDEENPDKIFPVDLHIDHIYMNLPKDAIEFMDVYVGLFKGCKENIYNKDNLPIVHVYGFAKIDEEPHEYLKKRIAKAFKMKYELFKEECEKNILNIENVRDISNKKVVYCIDIKIPSIVAFGNYTLVEEKEDEKENKKEEKEEKEEEEEN